MDDVHIRMKGSVRRRLLVAVVVVVLFGFVGFVTPSRLTITGEVFFLIRITDCESNFEGDEERLLMGSLRRRFPAGNDAVFCRVLSTVG